MDPQQLLTAAARLTAAGDVSLRDDPLTYAWRTTHDDATDTAPNKPVIDEAAAHVSAILGIPHTDQWWVSLSGRSTYQIAALLAVAANRAAPKGIES